MRRNNRFSWGLTRTHHYPMRSGRYRRRPSIATGCRTALNTELARSPQPPAEPGPATPAAPIRSSEWLHRHRSKRSNPPRFPALRASLRAHTRGNYVERHAKDRKDARVTSRPYGRKLPAAVRNSCRIPDSTPSPRASPTRRWNTQNVEPVSTMAAIPTFSPPKSKVTAKAIPFSRSV